MWHGQARVRGRLLRQRVLRSRRVREPEPAAAVGHSRRRSRRPSRARTSTRSRSRRMASRCQRTRMPAGCALPPPLPTSNTKVTESLSSGALTPSFNPAFPGIPIGNFSPLLGQRPFRRPANTGSLLVSLHAGTGRAGGERLLCRQGQRQHVSWRLGRQLRQLAPAAERGPESQLPEDRPERLVLFNRRSRLMRRSRISWTSTTSRRSDFPRCH